MHAESWSSFSSKFTKSLTMYRFCLLVSLAFLFMSSNAHRRRSRWVKLNECGKAACFEGRNNRPGVFHAKRAGFMAAVKLVQISGQIRCSGGAKLNSYFGCHNYDGLTKYPLNIAVTNSDNKIKFPTSSIT